MIYASFFSRLLAFIIDFIIISIAVSIIWQVFKIPAPDPAFTIGNIIFFPSLLAWIISIFYYGIMESSSKQATYGKIAVGIKVTDKNGEHLTFRKAGARTLNKFFSSIFFLGYLMFFFNKRNQTFHDWITNCIVTKDNKQIPATPIQN